MKKFILPIIFLVCLQFNCSAQTQNQQRNTDEDVFQFVEVMPEFPGGEEAMFTYIGNNIIFPKEFLKKGEPGKVIASFVINKKGELRKIKIIKSVGWGCDEAVLNMLKSMPVWKPGKQQGKPVNVSYTLPVVFELEEEVPPKTK